MQFDWTTFILELLNFLVLLWLLKRFFYQPVLAVLDARKQAVLDQAAQAQAANGEAAALRAQYEQRLQAWQQEREQSRQTLQQELAQERARQFDALRQALADERAKAKARATAQAAQRDAQLARHAAQQAYGEVAALLTRLADPALTARIVAIVVQDLASLPAEARAALQEAAAALAPEAQVELACAHALDAATLAGLGAALEQATGRALRLAPRAQPELIAGVRIAIGDRLLRANLAEELALFQRGADPDGGSHG